MQEQAPGIADVLRHWTPDVLWIGMLLGAGGLYYRGLRVVNGAQPRLRHPAWKAWSFGVGLALLAVATLSPVEYYGNQMLWVDFLGFLLITLWAPPLLLLGSPLTLAFRASGPKMRRRLRRAYRSPLVRWLTFPIASWLIFAVATYLWQFSVLTDLAAQHRLVREAQEVSLLAVALLFWLPALCADPVRWRIAYPLRGLYVFVEMTHKALFAAMFLSVTSPFHSYIAAHMPAYGPGPLDDQRKAIMILWLGGNLVFVAALAGIIARWMQYEGRTTARLDARLAKEREAARRHREALEQVFRKGV